MSAMKKEKTETIKRTEHTPIKKARHLTKATSTKHFGNKYLQAERGEGKS